MPSGEPLARLGEPHVEARCAHAVEQTVEVVEHGLRRVGLVVAELGEQHAHVAERAAGHPRDRVERPGRRLGPGARGEPRAVGLRDDDGERVGDHVVHVAGDAVALLLHGVAVLDEGALAVGEVLAAPHLARVAHGAGEQAGGPREHEHGDRRDEQEARSMNVRPNASPGAAMKAAPPSAGLRTPRYTVATTAPTPALARPAHFTTRPPCAAVEYSTPSTAAS